MIAKACIFDFDGVVVDSEKYHHLAWQWVAEAIGTDISYAEYAPFKSAGRQKVIPYLFEKAGKTMSCDDLARFSQLREEMATLALSRLNRDDIMPGVLDFISTLKANEVAVAVASASTSSHRIAKEFGIYDIFQEFVDGEAKLPHKPSPDIFLHTARLLGVDPKDCVVFEDSINGVLGAKSAGMHCVGVQTYFTDKADKIIDDFVGASTTLIEF